MTANASRGPSSGMLGEADRRRLLADVARLVEGHGGRIAVDYITHLLLARNAPLG